MKERLAFFHPKFNFFHSNTRKSHNVPYPTYFYNYRHCRLNVFLKFEFRSTALLVPESV